MLGSVKVPVAGVASIPLMVAFLIGGCDQLKPAEGIQWHLERGAAQVVVLPVTHIGIQHVRRLPAHLKRTLQDADLVYAETDLTSITLNDDLRTCTTSGFPAGQVPADVETVERVQAALPRVAKAIRSEGITYQHLMKLVIDDAYARSRHSVTKGTDWQLAEYARSHGVKIRSIETPCEQLEHAASVTEVVTREHVDEALRFHAANDAEALSVSVRAAWNAGDWTAMRSAIEQLQALYPLGGRFGSAQLMERRNEIMAQRISAVAKDATRTVVTVGALHLLGPKSVVEELQRLGFRVVASPGGAKGSP